MKKIKDDPKANELLINYYQKQDTVRFIDAARNKDDIVITLDNVAEAVFAFI